MGKARDIAVLIPVFNNQAGLNKTLDSLRDEAELFDIVIVDDGSKIPATIARDGFSTHLITLPENQGIENALNAGLHYILDEGYRYIARIDAGDTSVNERFRKQRDFLEANPTYGLVGSWFEMVDPEGQPQCIRKMPESDKAIRNAMHRFNAIAHPSVMMRADAVRTTGFYSSTFHSSEDYEYFFRMMQHTRIANLPEVLLHYEVMNNGSISFTRRRRQLRNTVMIQLRYFDYRNPHSYIGLLRTFASAFLSYRYAFKLRKLLYTKQRALNVADA